MSDSIIYSSQFCFHYYARALLQNIAMIGFNKGAEIGNFFAESEMNANN